MKIARIEIKNYHQFRELTVDLTYPQGHAKAGQCLDKVCFIGQSGTGKTSLLNMCRATFAQQFVPPDMNGVSVISLFPGTRIRQTAIEQGNLNVEYMPHILATLSNIELDPADDQDDEDFLREFYQNSMRLISYPAMLAYYSGSVLSGEASQGINDFIGIKPRKKETSEIQEEEQRFFDFTHSPIIASCFEPWEIVELQFDESGYVAQKQYYAETKERHVDNYRLDPHSSR